jgi:hypothetical protein
LALAILSVRLLSKATLPSWTIWHAISE